MGCDVGGMTKETPKTKAAMVVKVVSYEIFFNFWHRVSGVGWYWHVQRLHGSVNIFFFT